MERGLDEEAALLLYNLAPSECRRDMVMLGLIHRTVLGHGISQFHEFLQLAGPNDFGIQREAPSATA